MTSSFFYICMYLNKLILIASLYTVVQAQLHVLGVTRNCLPYLNYSGFAVLH